MSQLHVEKVGGLAGFGGAKANIRSRGHIDANSLSADDRRVVDGLFNQKGNEKASNVRDGFRYRLSRTTSTGTETVEVGESEVPASIAKCVKDEFV